jgi:hypothetical protein
MKPSNEVIETLKASQTEVGADKSFSNVGDACVSNNAHDRALSIVANYGRGEGLFQMTEN